MSTSQITVEQEIVDVSVDGSNVVVSVVSEPVVVQVVEEVVNIQVLIGGRDGIDGEDGIGLPSGGEIYQNPEKLSAANGDYGFYTPANFQTRLTDGYARGRVDIPRGVTPITTTQVTENKSALLVSGKGSPWAFSQSSPHMGSGSQIAWATSNTTLPMIKLDGGARTVWQHMALLGDVWNNSTSLLNTYGGKPTAGFLIAWNTALGAGLHQFWDIAFEGLAAGIQAGEDIDDGNCDMGVVVDAHFRNCDVGFLRKNKAVADWVFDRPVWQNNGNTNSSLFLFEAGGVHTCKNARVLNRCNLLTINNVGNQIGSNSGNYDFFQTTIDAGGVGACFLNVIDTIYTGLNTIDVTYTGGKMSTNGAGYESLGTSAAIFRGGEWLKFRDWRFRGDMRESLEWHTTGSTYPAICDFDSCRINIDDYENFEKPGSDGDLTLRLNNCRTFAGARIPDTEVTITASL